MIPTPATAKTPINAVLTVNESPEKPTPPTETDQGSGDQGTVIDGLLVLSMHPKH
ncbi:hypothetical protein [Enterococcus faecalis]|uniref:hypothetical protein n=1 Tax=Enterococcus faecalis TaxID=1351 RepID=UPI001F6182A1|nr:hypothetical protein [Enterococcus faecalis]